MILALDTSGTELVVALVDGGKQVSGLVRAGRRHQDQVIEAIDTVAGDHLKALDAVAVAVGPGSHTGLRVGLSTASGLAFARRLPIYPLSSLVVAAQRAPAEAGHVVAVVAAGRGKVYVQPFDRAGDGLRPAGGRRLESLEAVAGSGAVVAAEPALLARLGGAPGGRGGAEALSAAVSQTVGAGKAVNYDQLRGDYGEF
jgi:tRNA threonylcarbamoyladenosine biosynthesis protein TsaB